MVFFDTPSTVYDMESSTTISQVQLKSMICGKLVGCLQQVTTEEFQWPCLSPIPYELYLGKRNEILSRLTVQKTFIEFASSIQLDDHGKLLLNWRLPIFAIADIVRNFLLEISHIDAILATTKHAFPFFKGTFPHTVSSSTIIGII